jgi:hypothetical protein
MSTKINVRSPFYLNLSAPTVPTPEFLCSTAFPRGLDDTGFAVDNQGIITNPNPDFGVFVSLTSTDSGFSNNKYATVSTDTTRTITARTRIPAGFSNATDVHKDCELTAIQPGVTSSVVQPTVCSGGPATSGSISAVALDTGGNSTSIDLSTKFTGETTYAISNPNPTLVSTALSGSTLTISSNTLGGSVTLYAIGRDGSYPTTCEAVQSISVTISLPAGSPAYDCNTSPLTGGGIAQNGTITRPSTTGVILGVATSNGGSLLSPETVSANTGSTSQNVTLYFRIQVPPGYSNAGATLSPDCSVTFSQAGTALEDFSCTRAGLTKQSISKNGSINKGLTAEGTIVSFDPIGFDPVTTDTTRTVNFTIQIPSGYNNAGSNLPSPCPRTIVQPATAGQCGSNGYFISGGKQLPGDFCDGTFATTMAITSTGSSISGLMGTKICRNGTPFDGQSLRYAVNLFSTSSGAGVGVGDFYIIQIDGNGTVLSVEIHSCKSGGAGQGSQIL